MDFDGKIQSNVGQKAYQALLSAWMKCSGGRLPPGLTSISFVRKAALGDVLMAAAVAREFQKRNPKARVHFFTDYTELLEGLPFLDSVGRFEDRPKLHFNLRYEGAETKRRHWVEIIGETVGVTPTSVVPECNAFETATAQWRTKLENKKRPVVGLQRKAGLWTPNKDWPNVHFDELVEKLEGNATVIEIGGGSDLGELVGAIRNCNVVVGPISAPAHIAAAFGIPSVILSSGYESPEFTQYPTTTALRHEVQCSPCWLRTPCPYEMECMTNISVETVMTEIFRAIR